MLDARKRRASGIENRRAASLYSVFRSSSFGQETIEKAQISTLWKVFEVGEVLVSAAGLFVDFQVL